MPLFLVIKEDTVLQVTGYLVRANDQDHAIATVNAGMYIEETAPDTIDTLETRTVSAEEIKPEGTGQER